MDPKFWRQRWEENHIPFHLGKANPQLTAHFKKLAVPKGGRIFLPLCGKTLDIPWLLSKGYRVAGAELSKIAIDQLFEGLKIKPKITKLGKMDLYSAENIDIFVGDIFDLSRKTLGSVDAIYDRAALVALPPKMRERYTAHLMKTTDTAPQLLLSFEYDQSLMEGPPFSVTGDEVIQHYKTRYHLTLLETEKIKGGLKGICPATENVWLLMHES